MNKLFLLPLFFLTIQFSLSSCGGDDSASARKTYDYEKTDSLSKDYLRELGGVKVTIEQSAKLYKQMQLSGIAFDNSFATPASQNFGSTKQQAIGLGMIASGMSYAVEFDQQQVATSYLESLYSLAGKLGIEAAFDKDLIDKLVDPDTTIKKTVILTKAYLRAQDQLYSDDRAQLVTMMVFGGWIEGLNLSLKLVGNKPSDDQTINIGIFDQVQSYNSTKKMLEVFKESNKDVAELLEHLLSVEGSIKKVLNSRAKLNDEMLGNLSKDLDSLKKKII